MKAEDFVRILGADFYAGVPDSQLKALCDYLTDTWGQDPRHHVIAANEGNCAALAAGYQLATGKVPVVYLQNSGEGNIINPAASLLHREVYGIPVIFVIGWRGEPGVKDEPQHLFQGEVTLRLLEVLEMPAFVLGKETRTEELEEAMRGFREALAEGRDVAFVIRKGAISYDGKPVYRNGYRMLREEAIRLIAEAAAEDPVVSTTGKASRELFEIREARGESHRTDFLTVGSMGHASSIALGIALQRPEKRVWCLDGDGAALMHLGAMAVIGAAGPKNLIHVVLNNEAHETVGGMPTAAGKISLKTVARGCGYPRILGAEDPEGLRRALDQAKEADGLCLLEVRCAIGARADLGRPTLTPWENKEAFIRFLRSCQSEEKCV